MSQNTPEVPQQSRFPPPGDPIRVSIHGLFALGLLYTLYFGREVILPITLAVLTSLLLAPLVRKLARHKVPRAFSALGLLMAGVVIVATLLAATVRPAVEWMEQAPEGLSRLMVEGSELGQMYESMTDSAREVEEQLAETAAADEPEAVVVQQDSWRSQVMIGLRDSLLAVALALALSFFLLVNGDQLIRHFVRQLPGRRRRLTALRLIRDGQREIASYLGFITVMNSLTGLATGVLAWALGLPSPAIWGLLAALLRFVPYLGVVLTVAVLAVVSAETHTAPWMIAAAPLGYLLLSSIVGFFLEPYLHGFRTAINPIVIFVSIFFWGWLWGPVGVVLAVPLMTVIQAFLGRVDKLRPLYRIIAR